MSSYEQLNEVSILIQIDKYYSGLNPSDISTLPQCVLHIRALCETNYSFCSCHTGSYLCFCPSNSYPTLKAQLKSNLLH